MTLNDISNQTLAIFIMVSVGTLLIGGMILFVHHDIIAAIKNSRREER